MTTLLLLALPVAAHAGPQLFTPSIQQCDGSYASGGTTRKSGALVQATMQDTDAVGLKTGQQPSDFYSTIRLGEHFSDTYRVEASSCITDGVSVASQTYAWYYADTSGTSDKGLLGAYFDNMDFSNLFSLQIDATVDQTPGSGAPLTGMGPDQYSQRWTGYVVPPGSGAYTFCTNTSDGSRLYLQQGGLFVTLVDSWTFHTASQLCSPTAVTLTSGQPYEIVMEHFQNCSSGVSCTADPGNAHLLWSGPGIVGTAVIASTYLRPYLVPKIGQCTYTNSVTPNCVAKLTLNNGNDPNNVPLSFNPPTNLGFSCPASTFSAPGVASINTGTFAMPAVAAPFDAANKDLQFDGTKNFAQLSMGGQWYLPPTYTLSAWIKTPGPVVGGQPMRIMSQQNAGYWLLRVSAGGHLDAEDSRDGGPGDLGGPVLTDNNWHFVAAKRINGSAWKYYVDGVNVANGVPTSTTTEIMGLTMRDNGADRAYLGALQGPAAPAGGSEYFQGFIDEPRIYPGQLNDDTLLMEYAANAYRYSTNGGVSFGVSTSPYSGAPANGTQGLVTLLPPPLTNSNSRFSFIAQSADGLSTVTGPTFTVNLDQTPPAAPTLVGNPTASNAITWTFGTTSVCNDGVNNFFSLFESSTGIHEADSAVGATTISETYVGEPPNTSHCRAGKTHDVWGTGPLGAPTTAYTLPADPTGLTASSLGTTNISLTWNANANPVYTRYELSMSLNNFTAPPDVSTPILISANYTGTTYNATGLTPGTPYFFRVRAANGRSTDLFGGKFSGYSFFSTFTTPVAPVVTAQVQSNTRIDWHWNDVKGATSYNLYSAGAPLPFASVPSPGVVGSDVSYSSTGLLTNNLYGIQIQPVNTGNGPLSPATYAYTFSLAPAALAVTAVSTNSASLSWDAGAAPPLANPAYTYYEVAVATDPLFAVVVATQTTQSLALTVAGLFPASTYYARIRAFNGNQAPTGFTPALPPAAQVAAITNPNPDVSVSSGPPSAYAPPNGVVGLWQFDENGGTTARDSTGYGNNGTLTCQIAFCVSTPTYTAGPAGLGTAASLTGQTSSLILVPDAAQYDFSGALSVGAWVDPATAAMPNGAAIVAKGPFGGEAFSLDVVGSRYRFLVFPGVSVTAPAIVDVGSWHRVLGTWDGANANLYVDGQLVAGPVAFGGARNIVATPLLIGNRKSNTAAYDLGFAGGIDSVLLVGRALSAAEALSDYQGAFTAATTLPPPNNRVKLTLPPNAFGAPTEIYASNDPIGHPIKVDPLALNNGLLNVPTGHTLVTGSLIEIVPTVGGQAFTLPLGSSATLALPYNDANGDGIIDGSNPPISVNTLQVYTLDTTIGKWNLLPSGVDPANKAVNATTPHFSIFGLFGATTIGASLSLVRVYPKPWIIGSTGRFSATNLTFDRLPANGSIKIFGLAGERVKELTFTSNDAGKILWDGRNAFGEPVASGVYFAYLVDSDSHGTVVLKFAIER